MRTLLAWSCALAVLIPLSWAGHAFTSEPKDVATASSGCAHVVDDTFAGGDGAVSPFVIANREQLELLRDDTTFWDDSFLLTSSISLGNCEWDSTIGDDTVAFTGHFDGGNNYIRGLNVNITGDYSTNIDGGVAGVFGVLGTGSYVQRLNVSGSVTANITGASAFAYAGGIAGRGQGASILSSSFVGTVTALSAENHSYAGGIIGSGDNMLLERVSVAASVSATLGFRPAAGGIGARLSNSTLREAWSGGSVLARGSDESMAGGLIGSAGSCVIQRSFSEASVTADPATEESAGGLVGVGDVRISNSYSRSSVSGQDFTGGLVGWLLQTDPSMNIQRAYFAGPIGPGTARAIGGMGGRLRVANPAVPRGEIDASFWDQNVTGLVRAIGEVENSSNPLVTNALPKTTLQMTSFATYDDSGWNISNGYRDDSVWSICSGANDGYPILSSFFSSSPCAGQVATLTPSSQSVAGTIGLSFSTTPIVVTGVTDPFFTVSPALPAGWTFDPLTGVISGTRSFAASDTTYTLTAISPVPLQRGTASVVMQATPSSPTIASVAPNSGSTSGGTTVTITGTDFEAGASVTFGSTAGTVTSLTPTEITVVTPAAGAGLVDVTVTNLDSGTVTSSGAFTFIAPPRPPRPVPTPTDTPSPTPTPTPTPSPSPSPSPTGPRPAPTPPPAPSLKRGQVELTIDGTRDMNVTAQGNRQRRGLIISGDGFTIRASGLAANGSRLPLTRGGSLQLELGQAMRNSGVGFLPDSEVASFLSPVTVTSGRGWLVDLFIKVASSVPVGSFVTNEAGVYRGQAIIPAATRPGAHVLQVVGWTPEGKARVVSLAIVVKPSVAMRTRSDGASDVLNRRPSVVERRMTP